MLYRILHFTLHGEDFTIRTVFFSIILMTPLYLLYCFFFCSNGFFFYKFSPNHIFTSSRFSCLSLVYCHVNNFYNLIGPNRDLQSHTTHKTRIAQKMSSRLFCTNTLTVASLTSPTMRRDYYRGSQDSLTAAHLDDRRSGPLYRGGSLRGMHYTHSLTLSLSMQSHTH